MGIICHTEPDKTIATQKSLERQFFSVNVPGGNISISRVNGQLEVIYYRHKTEQ